MSRLWYLCAAIACFALGCGEEDPDRPQALDGHVQRDPRAEQGCLDLAAAYADAFARCGEDPDLLYGAFIKQVVNGSCENVYRLRDEKELREECIPWFESVTCEELYDPYMEFPSSCEWQLEL